MRAAFGSPTVGFYAKLLVLEAIIDQNLVWLAIAAVLFSVIGAGHLYDMYRTANRIPNAF